ncbi:YhhA family cyclophane-containing RiPP [Mucilaginibacter sp. OK098]|uniref:YhhA family cyclophane-containing RiPP n=1 Tax=Mucilaginibacter sp. OK098 TaxID=1855297 RepID=UPI00091D6A53|nr:YhhA family cyclophane-containing RiPP [Mucilaginibacter sp. OK098]SHN36178.1 hypothetical protein SAMN05216524_11316 [Mucilaginibacter sp. OK098]
MDFNNQPQSDFAATESSVNQQNNVLNVNEVPNAVLQRLMAEVKNDQANDMYAYDRAHNRHNRS